MTSRSVVGLLLLLIAPAFADDAPSPSATRAHVFEYSLFKPRGPSGEFVPFSEAEQRPLFEAFIKTVKTREDKLAFLGIAGYQYVNAVHPNVLSDFAAPLLKDDDAAVRLAAVNAIGFCTSDMLRIENTDIKRIDAHVDAVAALMADRDESVRVAAHTCVGMLQGDHYLDALIAALDKDPSDAVRAGAAVGLVSFARGSEAPQDMRRKALSAATKHLVATEKQVVLKAMLESTSGMGDLDTHQYADNAASLLANKELRVPAMRALRGLNATAHAGEIAALVFGPDGRADYDAVDSLYRIATREQIPTLVRLIENGGTLEQDYALEALDRLDARDQRPVVERAAAAEKAAGLQGTSAIVLLRKWDTPAK